MKNLVDSKIDSSWSYFQGTDAAGKTGTADYNLANGESAKPHSWFIGFAPANDPKVAVAVIVENGGYGASAAAPIAGKVMKQALIN
jgi:peptidoglycan glycosyltransferase